MVMTSKGLTALVSTTRALTRMDTVCWEHSLFVPVLNLFQYIADTCKPPSIMYCHHCSNQHDEWNGGMEWGQNIASAGLWFAYWTCNGSASCSRQGGWGVSDSLHLEIAVHGRAKEGCAAIMFGAFANRHGCCTIIKRATRSNADVSFL
jgi:hypothetical protein